MKLNNSQMKVQLIDLVEQIDKLILDISDVEQELINIQGKLYEELKINGPNASVFFDKEIMNELLEKTQKLNTVIKRTDDLKELLKTFLLNFVE